MTFKKQEILLNALLDNSPEESMRILKDAGVFVSIQCHGYAIRAEDHEELKTESKKNNKKWWQFWK